MYRGYHACTGGTMGMAMVLGSQLRPVSYRDWPVPLPPSSQCSRCMYRGGTLRVLPLWESIIERALCPGSSWILLFTPTHDLFFPTALLSARIRASFTPHRGRASAHQGIRASEHQGIRASGHQSISASGHQGIRAAGHPAHHTASGASHRVRSTSFLVSLS